MNIVGRARFVLESVKVPRAPFCTVAGCLLCGQDIRVERGAVMAVFKVGTEVVGLVCDHCLAPESRSRLAQLREYADRGTVTR